MNMRNPSGKTPLMLAVSGGHMWIMEALLQSKAGTLKKGLQIGHRVAWRAPTAHGVSLAHCTRNSQGGFVNSLQTLASCRCQRRVHG